MKFLEFLDILSLENNSGNGTFVGARLTKNSEKKLLHWMKENKIRKAVPRKDLHVTVLLDKKREFKWSPVVFDPPLEIKSDSFKLKKFGEDDNVLVLSFSQPELEKRHEEGIEKHGIDWDFPSYIPHITLSYDSDADPKDLLLPTFPLFLEKEYVTEYETDWASTSVSESIINEVSAHYRITTSMIRNAVDGASQFIVEMSPEDFLKLTAPRESRTEIENRSLSLLRYNRLAKSGDIDIMPNLTIFIENERVGVVHGHEGRARAVAMIKAGMNTMPVAISLRISRNSSYVPLIDRKNPNNNKLRMTNTKYKLNYGDLPPIIKGEFEGTGKVSSANWFLKVPDLLKHMIPSELTESSILTERLVTNREEILAYASKWASNISKKIPIILQNFPNIEEWFKRNLSKMALGNLPASETFKLVGRNEEGKIVINKENASGVDLLIFNNEQELVNEFSSSIARFLLNGEKVESLVSYMDQVIDNQELNYVLDYFRHLHNDNPKILEPHRLNRITFQQVLDLSIKWHENLAKSTGKDLSDRLSLADYEQRELIQEFDDGFGWYILPSDICLKREGDLMGHCVGSYSDDIMEGKKLIVSLRGKNNKPHVTIGLSIIERESDRLECEIEEIKGRANEVPHSKYRKYIDAFIGKFENSLDGPISIEFPDSTIMADYKDMIADFVLLGYISLPENILRIPGGKEYIEMLNVHVETNDNDTWWDIVSRIPGNDISPRHLLFISYWISKVMKSKSAIRPSGENPDHILYDVLRTGSYTKKYGRNSDIYVKIFIDTTDHKFIKVV